MELWQHLLSKLRDNHQVYLLTVIDNIGSSPGRQGFKMIVSDDGFIFGSIGGGVMEYSLVEKAKDLLGNGDLRIFLERQIHRGHKEYGSGMICSGEQTVVFHPLGATQISFVEEILKILEFKNNGCLVLTPTNIYLSEDIIDNRFACEITSANDWMYKENIDFLNTLYIVGGGHVSVAVSDLFVTLGFQVIVLDNRENLNTLELNNSAHLKKVVNFNEIANHISEGSQSFVAIMTNKYVDDKLVLSKLIEKNFAYIGVLGSQAKLRAMWEVFRREGVTEEQLDHVYGPIGLPIKSQTPTEIAVSIAAEVIKMKNMKQ